MKYLLIFIFTLIITFLLLFIWCACKLASEADHHIELLKKE